MVIGQVVDKVLSGLLPKHTITQHCYIKQIFMVKLLVKENGNMYNKTSKVRNIVTPWLIDKRKIDLQLKNLLIWKTTKRKDYKIIYDNGCV